MSSCEGSKVHLRLEACNRVVCATESFLEVPGGSLDFNDCSVSTAAAAVKQLLELANNITFPGAAEERQDLGIL